VESINFSITLKAWVGRSDKKVWGYSLEILNRTPKTVKDHVLWANFFQLNTQKGIAKRLL